MGDMDLIWSCLPRALRCSSSIITPLQAGKKVRLGKEQPLVPHSLIDNTQKHIAVWSRGVDADSYQTRLCLKGKKKENYAFKAPVHVVVIINN